VACSTSRRHWKLGISETTLQIHRGRIMQKMAAGSFADLVRMAATLRVR
jgi:FixJ family two-component response regulator